MKSVWCQLYLSSGFSTAISDEAAREMDFSAYVNRDSERIPRCLPQGGFNKGDFVLHGLGYVTQRLVFSLF
jgi:hypothetical protein